MESCSDCNDTGYVCAECLEADGDCKCEEGPDLIPCENCPDEDDDE